MRTLRINSQVNESNRSYILSALLIAFQLSGGFASAQSIFEITPRPEPPRGKLGTFKTLWMQRLAPHPKPGIASFYNDPKTATGERLRPYDREHLTCSHPEPSELGQRYIVRNGKLWIECLVNDIGPAKYLNRAIDLTPAGFEMLGFDMKAGLGHVTIERK